MFVAVFFCFFCLIYEINRSYTNGYKNQCYAKIVMLKVLSSIFEMIYFIEDEYSLLLKQTTKLSFDCA